jgi:hypothetical protein
MTIFGKPLSEYVQFSKLFVVLVPIVGIVRLALSLSGESNSMVKWISVTVFVWIGVVYYSVRVHTARFGGYQQLLVICAILNVLGQVVIVAGIVLSALTGTANIYSAPEYGGTLNPWIHAGLHLVVATTLGSLVPWLLGSLILFVTKKLASSDSKVKSMA